MTLPAIRYGIDDRPPITALLLYGLQWLAVMGVATLIIGKVVAALHFDEPAAQFLYMQKLLLLSGIVLVAQVWIGHRLPLVVGPATILLVGIMAGGNRDVSAIDSSILVGGGVLTLICASGLFRHVAKLFTSRVVATILILIALTITPTILKLVLEAPHPKAVPINLLFSLVLLLAMVAGDKLLKGIWRSTLLFWSLLGGSLAAMVLLSDQAPDYHANLPLFGSMFQGFTTTLTWDPGLILAFLICYIALAVNDLGSIESLGKLLNPPAMERRLTRGMVLTGIANVAAGFLGVIGVVNYSLTAGVIVSNGNVSRISFLPAALCLMLIAFMPSVVALAWIVPAVVIGTILLHIMSLQLAAGLMMAFGDQGFTFHDAVVISISVMVSVMVSFFPPEVTAAFPRLILPLAGNGFVIGTLTVLLLDHVLLRKKQENPS